MENRKVVFICAPYDEKDPAAHAKEIALVAHFRALVEKMYHYKTFAPGSYITGPSKEAKEIRVEIEDAILKNCYDYKGKGTKCSYLPGSGRQKGSNYYDVCRTGEEICVRKERYQKYLFAHLVMR